MSNKDLLANLYKQLLEECLTAGAADMNNYCPVNSRTQVAGQFPSQAYLFVYIICKSARPRVGHQDMMQMFIGQQILIVTPLFLFSRIIFLSVSRPLNSLN